VTVSTDAMNCRVCGEKIDHPALDLPAPALTGSNEQVAMRTRAYVCDACGHVQSPDLPDIEEFYDKRYKCALASEEYDQLCEIRDGVPLYRTDAQATLALAMTTPPRGANVLDYGAGKAATLRKIWAQRPDISPHVFDVSEDYHSSWNAWLPSEAIATYELPKSWYGRFDVIMAHCVLEHVQEPVATLRALARLLAPGGRLYLLVPDWTANIGDLLVAEHTNHFTTPSLRRAAQEAGLHVDAIDAAGLPSTVAVVCHADPTAHEPIARSEIERTVAHARSVASSLQQACHRIDGVIAASGDRPAAIFGAGFYGAFLAARMAERAPAACFIDNNHHLWGSSIFGVPVVPPDKLPQGTDLVFVGVNPARARAIAATVPSLQRPGLDLIYMD